MFDPNGKYKDSKLEGLAIGEKDNELWLSFEGKKAILNRMPLETLYGDEGLIQSYYRSFIP